MNKVVHVPVRSVMTSPVQIISRLASIKEAVELMHERQTSSLVVERRDAEDEYGILTLTDIASKVIAENRVPARVNVYEIMSKPVVMVPESMEIRFAVQLLIRFNLSRAPVHDEKRNLVGIISLRDAVLRHLRNEMADAED